MGQMQFNEKSWNHCDWFPFSPLLPANTFLNHCDWLLHVGVFPLMAFPTIQLLGNKPI